MQQLINELKRLRAKEMQAKEEVATCQANLEQSIAYQDLQKSKERLAGIQEILNQVDSQLRNEALAEYDRTGNKKPVTGISIVINTNLKYLPVEAIKWCKDNALDLLKLDIRNFEKHARAVSKTVPLDFVEIEELPGVRIASKL